MLNSQLYQNPNDRRPALTAIIPAYNERGRIGNILSVLLQAEFVDEIIASASFVSADTDDRFVVLFEALQPRSETHIRQAETWSADDGAPIATFRQARKKASLTVDESEAPEFGRFVFDRLPELYRTFRKNKGSISGV